MELPGEAIPMALPPSLAGWVCFFGETERLEGAYVKRATCGGKWGFVDILASCDVTHRKSLATMRLRQASDGRKDAAAAAMTEKVTIAVGCSYPGDHR
jgi:hypothetical protein